MQQDVRAEYAAENAQTDQRQKQAARFGRERVAIGDRAGESAGPDGDGVSGVGGDRRNAGEKQRREGDEAAAAGDGVDGSGQKCREEEEGGMVERHKKE